MGTPNKEIFLQLWPKCFIIFMGVIGLISVIILILTELGNVAANFWTTNVFAGGWAGLILLIFVILVFINGCKSPGPESAFRAVVLAVIGLIASAALISFDAAFIARPSTCILTPSCADNSVSNTTFSYNFQQSFFTVFNGWGPFKNYGQSHVKFLCQTIQIGIGALSFILYIIYLIIYYSCSSKAQKQVQPAASSRVQPWNQPPGPPRYNAPAPYNAPLPVSDEPSYYPQPPPSGVHAYYPVPSAPPPVMQPYLPPPPPPQAQPGYYPPGPPIPVQPAWRPPVYGQQPAPGAVAWNPYGRY